MKDYFKVLGVPYNATSDEINKAGKKLLQKHHPDRNGNEQIFKEIKEARSILLNPEKKRNYLSEMKTAKTKDPLKTLEGIWSNILGEENE